MARPALQRLELVTVSTLDAAPAEPMVTNPALVMMPPELVSELLLATPLPMVTAPPSIFHVALEYTLTVLFELLVPMVNPLLQIFALVAVRVLKLPPAVLPTVIAFLLDRVLSATPPPILAKLFEDPRPTLTPELMTNKLPPLLIIKLLP